MAKLCVCDVGPSRRGNAPASPQSNVKRRGVRCRIISVKSRRLIMFRFKDLALPSNADRLGHLQSGYESLPVHWCYLVDSKSSSYQDQCWVKVLPVRFRNSHEAVLIHVRAISCGIHPQARLSRVHHFSVSASQYLWSTVQQKDFPKITVYNEQWLMDRTTRLEIFHIAPPHSARNYESNMGLDGHRQIKKLGVVPHLEEFLDATLCK